VSSSFEIVRLELVFVAPAICNSFPAYIGLLPR
jgi:hypothetical protein